VVVDGDGEPLLLIPGLGAGRSAFIRSFPTWPAAPRHHLRPSGIGESEGVGNTTLTAMAADVWPCRRR